MSITINTGPGGTNGTGDNTNTTGFNSKLDGQKAEQEKTQRGNSIPEPQEPEKKQGTWIQVGEDIWENQRTGERGWPNGDGNN